MCNPDWPSKPDVPGAHLSNADSHPGLGNLMWGLVPSLLGENLYKFSHLWVTHFGGSDSKVSAYNAGNPGSIPGAGGSPGEGNGNPLQYS